MIPPANGRRHGRVLSQADVNKLRREVGRIDRISRAPDARPQQAQGSPRVVIVFLVSRLGMIPMFLFVILPRKTMEAAAPIGNQFLVLTGTFMNLMSRVMENVARAFAPVKNFVNRVQEGIERAVLTGVEVYKALQQELSRIASQIKMPVKLDFAPLMKNLHEWARRATDFKHLYSQLAQYISKAMSGSKEGSPFLAQVFKVARQFNESVERVLERFGEKIAEKTKQFKEKIVEPVKQFFEAATAAVQEVASATLAHIQTTVQPFINLAVTAGVAAKEFAQGKMQNFVEVVRAIASNVQGAVASIARNVANIYQQLIVQTVVLPMIATLQAGWNRVSATFQKLANHATERFNAILRELKDLVKRLATRLQALFGAIQGWAQRKWKQKWLPTLKQIPKKAKAIWLRISHVVSSFWKAFLAALKELFWLFAEFGLYLYNMMRDIFREVMAQNASWK
jgi:ElaB/YqjD/DUF883 family membrane-anchored ribosome-binding protein